MGLIPWPKEKPIASVVGSRLTYEQQGQKLRNRRRNKAARKARRVHRARK